MSTPIIQIENLGKKYMLRHQVKQSREYKLLSEDIINTTKNIFDKKEIKNKSIEEFWALRNITLDINQGNILGIIGRNGAGKSTLLKVLSRITEPTEGRVRLRGRVASLLEVGTGFHPELTGRENIYLNGSILGMTRSEIRKNFDEIVAFADVEKFIDTPIKRYSSGMFVRLAFSVAAHVEPEILIIDEILAVGDAGFQKKCLGKMKSVGQSGRTVLFVSHQMAAIQNLCDTCILLSGGKLVDQGKPEIVIRNYQSMSNEENQDIKMVARKDREGSGNIRFTDVQIQDEKDNKVNSLVCGKQGTLVLSFMNNLGKELRDFHISIGINNEFNQRILLLDSEMVQGNFESISPDTTKVRVTIPKVPLIPGRYSLTLFSTIKGMVADWIRDAAYIDVEESDYFGTGRLTSSSQSLVITDHYFRVDNS